MRRRLFLFLVLEILPVLLDLLVGASVDSAAREESTPSNTSTATARFMFGGALRSSPNFAVGIRPAAWLFSFRVIQMPASREVRILLQMLRAQRTGDGVFLAEPFAQVNQPATV